MEEQIKFEPVPILDDWSLIGTDIGMIKWVSKEEFEKMFRTEPKPISTETGRIAPFPSEPVDGVKRVTGEVEIYPVRKK